MNLIREHKYFVFIFLSSLIPFIPFFITNDLLHTHDGLVHVPRLASYYHALLDGDFPVRFAGYLNYGYGLPLFNFIYQTPYLVGSLFLLLGLSLVNAFKISLLLSFVISGVSMYLFGREYFSDVRKGLLIAIFYQFAPFRMVELLVRGSYGEVYTYAFFPLVLYGLALLENKKTKFGMTLTSFATGFLIISHNSVSLLFFGALLLFLLITTNSLKILVNGLVSLFIGLISASFYWIPAIMEHKYTYGNLFMENLYKNHFVPIQNLFIPNIFNLREFQTEGITTFIGVFQFFAIIIAVVLFITKSLDNKTKRLFAFYLVLIVISFFFMLPISSPIWGLKTSSFLRQFQFPWRFLSLVVIGTSMLAVSFPLIDKRFKNKYSFAGLTMLVVLSVSFFFQASLGYNKINEKYYWNFPLNTTYYGETDVIWSAGPAKSYPKTHIEIISGKGKIYNFIKKNTFQTFTAESLEELGLVSNTQYFPGWKVYVNGGEVPIQFQDPNHRGLLVFSVPKGENQVKVIFEENKLRKLADFMSIIGVLLIIPIALIFGKRK